MEKIFNSVKDSKKRQSFETGSVRDSEDNKGNPSLIPGQILKLIYEMDFDFFSKKSQDINLILDNINLDLYEFGQTWKLKDELEKSFQPLILSLIKNVCILIILDRDEAQTNILTYPFRRLAVHYQNGAIKYDKNNWRKGQPISRYYDSACRHLWSFMEKNEEEDHLAALLWNLCAIIVTKKDIENKFLPEDLYDFPFTYSTLF